MVTDTTQCLFSLLLYVTLAAALPSGLASGVTFKNKLVTRIVRNLK